MPPSTQFLTPLKLRAWADAVKGLLGRKETPEARPPSKEAWFNPEDLTQAKREWMDTMTAAGVDKPAEVPKHLFEYFCVVGLAPDMEITTIAEDLCERERRIEEDGEEEDGSFQQPSHPRSRGGRASGSSSSAQQPPWPSYEPQILHRFPDGPDSKPPLTDAEIGDLCFPYGVAPTKLKRTPSLSNLTAAVHARQCARQEDCFVFMLKCSGSFPLFGVCCYATEFIHRPPYLAKDAWPWARAPYRQCAIVAPRCYMLLTRYPFFQMHVHLLTAILSTERLQRSLDFAQEQEVAQLLASGISNAARRPQAHAGEVGDGAAAVSALPAGMSKVGEEEEEEEEDEGEKGQEKEQDEEEAETEEVEEEDGGREAVAWLQAGDAGGPATSLRWSSPAMSPRADPGSSSVPESPSGLMRGSPSFSFGSAWSTEVIHKQYCAQCGPILMDMLPPADMVEAAAAAGAAGAASAAQRDAQPTAGPASGAARSAELPEAGRQQPEGGSQEQTSVAEASPHGAIMRCCTICGNVFALPPAEGGTGTPAALPSASPDVLSGRSGSASARSADGDAAGRQRPLLARKRSSKHSIGGGGGSSSSQAGRGLPPILTSSRRAAPLPGLTAEASDDSSDAQLASAPAAAAGSAARPQHRSLQPQTSACSALSGLSSSTSTSISPRSPRSSRRGRNSSSQLVRWSLANRNSLDEEADAGASLRSVSPSGSGQQRTSTINHSSSFIRQMRESFSQVPASAVLTITNSTGQDGQRAAQQAQASPPSTAGRAFQGSYPPAAMLSGVDDGSSPNQGATSGAASATGALPAHTAGWSAGGSGSSSRTLTSQRPDRPWQAAPAADAPAAPSPSPQHPSGSPNPRSASPPPPGPSSLGQPHSPLATPHHTHAGTLPSSPLVPPPGTAWSQTSSLAASPLHNYDPDSPTTHIEGTGGEAGRGMASAATPTKATKSGSKGAGPLVEAAAYADTSMEPGVNGQGASTPTGALSAATSPQHARLGWHAQASATEAPSASGRGDGSAAPSPQAHSSQSSMHSARSFASAADDDDDGSAAAAGSPLAAVEASPRSVGTAAAATAGACGGSPSTGFVSPATSVVQTGAGEGLSPPGLAVLPGPLATPLRPATLHRSQSAHKWSRATAERGKDAMRSSAPGLVGQAALASPRGGSSVQGARGSISRSLSLAAAGMEAVAAAVAGALPGGSPGSLRRSGSSAGGIFSRVMSFAAGVSGGGGSSASEAAAAGSPLPPLPPTVPETPMDLSSIEPILPSTLLSEIYARPVPAPGESCQLLPPGAAGSCVFTRPALPPLMGSSGLSQRGGNGGGHSLGQVLAAAEQEAAEQLQHWTVAALCRSLPLDAILTMLTAVLLERQLVVACSCLGTLAAVVLSLLPLLRPYSWHSLLMPLTPASMLTFLEAPVPFVLGVQYRTPEVAARAASCVSVDVRIGAGGGGEVLGAEALPLLPGRRQLHAALLPHYARLRSFAGAAAGRAVTAISAEEEEAARALLQVAQQHLADLCGDLLPHTITNVGLNKRTAYLMKDSLLDDAPPRDRPFVRAFMETQMFTAHSDAVISAFCEQQY